jgi:hypothetical protein
LAEAEPSQVEAEAWEAAAQERNERG